MEKIPTAKEFIIQNKERFEGLSVDVWLVEFAQLHVQAALEAAAENIPTEVSIDEKTFDKMGIRYLSEESEQEIKKSILKAYSFKNIK